MNNSADCGFNRSDSASANARYNALVSTGNGPRSNRSMNNGTQPINRINNAPSASYAVVPSWQSRIINKNDERMNGGTSNTAYVLVNSLYRITQDSN